jgi:hypothetical protein
MTLDSANMTHAEHYRLNGTLSPARCEELIEIADAVDRTVDLTSGIDEALRQYPNEDFLQEAITDLGYLARGLRGANRTMCKDVIDTLELLQTETNYAAEYGREELRKVLAAATALQP